ncbi:hypothetical protein ABZ016_23900 [Streptomyces sp. NPDC006372]|uniref:hypothetical protein n=1 Tax=Streptomyces sp. NPDC006372 TaxID=3155599 RepID=UPI0033A7DDC9
MPNLIPAAPGWYLRSEAVGATDPIIAWLPSIDGDAPTLLPFVPDGRGYSPTLVDAKALAEHEWEVVYLPNYDPASVDE